MKIYIVQDMEGVSGVVEWGRDLETRGEKCALDASRLMTHEINAAIAGALAAGATDLLVEESHKFLFEELHQDARYVMGSARPQIDESCDGVFFVGQHAMANTTKGVLAHSYSSMFVSSMSLNGDLIGEFGLLTVYAGWFDVPVILATGDAAMADEAKAMLGDIETAIVKEGLGINAAICMSAQNARALITEKALAAVKRIKDFKPYKITTPMEFRITFTKPIIVERCMLFPGAKKIDATTVSFESDDFIKIYDFRCFTALVNWF